MGMIMDIKFYGHCYLGAALQREQLYSLPSRRFSVPIAAAICLLSAQSVLVPPCNADDVVGVDKIRHNRQKFGESNNTRKEDTSMAKIYEFKEKALDGTMLDFSTYKGNVLLIVNTASECGFTPQYKGLEELNEKYQGRGLKILGFPCNQFGHQEPGDSDAIGSFCQKNYGVTFQMFEKIDVNGKNADPLYKYLTSAAPGILGSEAIKWNFTKFLIDRNGAIVRRFGSNVVPKDIAPEIEKLL